MRVVDGGWTFGRWQLNIKFKKKWQGFLYLLAGTAGGRGGTFNFRVANWPVRKEKEETTGQNVFKRPAEIDFEKRG